MKYEIVVHFTDGKTAQWDIETKEVTKLIDAISTSNLYFNAETRTGIFVPPGQVRLVEITELGQSGTPVETTMTTTTDTKAPYGRKKDGTPKKRPGRRPPRTQRTETATA